MRRFDRSNNPLLNEERLMEQSRNISQGVDQVMTREGAINKSIILVGIMLLTAVYSFANPTTLMLWGGMIGGLVLFFLTMFKPKLAPYTGPMYAGFEGLMVGAISAIYGGIQGGIIFQAVSITICILLVMLMIYRSNIIPVTNKLRTIIITGVSAIFMLYMVAIGLSFFGISIPYLHTGGPIGIGISLVIIGFASFMLLLDFDSIDKGDKMGLPKYMEWYYGMGLLATLVWIYIEVLRLVAILSRD